MRDRRHFVSFVKSRTETLIQEYQADHFTDMFQVWLQMWSLNVLINLIYEMF